MPLRRISLSEVGRRNVVYSDAEQMVIKNGLKTTKAGLRRLDTLRSKRAGRRRQLKDQIYQYKVALAPFKKIPNEIWMYIFELYCHSESGQQSTCDTLAGQLPVVLTQVCSAWRQIVLSMPELWSDVHLGENVNLARMWLGRAGNIPRTLETSTPWSHCSSSNRAQTRTVICLFPFRKLHLTRWVAAGMDFTGIPVESLLLLEDLALLRPAWDSPDLGVTSFSPHHFPNLVSLRIDTNIIPRFHASRPFVTWKKLRVLELKCVMKRANCLEILRDASSVEDCSLQLSLKSYYDQDPTIENAVVANLKILRLSFSYSLSLWSFLDHFTYPNLHTLMLISQHSITFWPSDRSQLLRLAPCIGSLRSLNIDQSYIKVDVGVVLECLPLLQVLELHGAKITTQTAEKIGRGELGGCLRELYDWSSNNLYGFLRACELRWDVTQGQSPNRLGAIASLEKVSVWYGYRYSKSVTDCKWRIRKLRKAGIEFEVFQQPEITSVSTISGCTCS